MGNKIRDLTFHSRCELLGCPKRPIAVVMQNLIEKRGGGEREREIGGGKTKKWENSGKMIQFHNLSDCSL